MDRHLFIVARDQSSLCAYLQREFSSEQNVEVFLDRRSGRDRRVAAPAPAAQNRRSADRRTRRFVETQLRSTGYAMLRLGQTGG